MTTWQLVVAGLRHHRRLYATVAAGCALATTIIGGALIVGNSVRESLRNAATMRIGKIEGVWVSPERFFRSLLSDKVAAVTGRTAASVLALRGSGLGRRLAGDGDGLRVGGIQVLGVDEHFWKLSPSGRSVSLPTDDGLILNRQLAKALGVAVGDEVLLRIEKPSLLSRDAPLSKIEDSTVALAGKVAEVVGDNDFGSFALTSEPRVPLACYVPRKTLQGAVGIADTANLMLLGAGDSGDRSRMEKANQALWTHWTLEDGGLEVRTERGQFELRTKRVFLEPAAAKLASAIRPDTESIFTYFVNELRHGGKSTPYSTVTAMTRPPGPADLADDEIVINTWLAEDLGLVVGDSLELAFWVVGPLRRLEERTEKFRVRAIVPVSGVASDPKLMPDIPGLTDKKDCREWEPGVPIDLDRIRDKDQAWWTRHRGTPKAFLTLAAGQRIWKNRFGDLTALRWPVANASDASRTEEALRRSVNAASLGVLFQPLAKSARDAAEQSMDFGPLFLGLSLFLVVASLVLVALLFALGVQQRAAEAGILKAIGWSGKQVAAVFLREAAVVAALGSLLGVMISAIYARGIISALGGVWSGAVAGNSVAMHASVIPLVTGGLAGFILSLASLYWVLAFVIRAAPKDLLGSSAQGTETTGRRRRILGPISLVGIALSVLWAAFSFFARTGDVAAFFGCGSLLLLSGSGLFLAALAPVDHPTAGHIPGPVGLAVQFARRRAPRSAAVTLLFAAGTFLVVSVGANRPDIEGNATRRDSGTGGFSLWMETSLPVFQDINQASTQEEFGLDPDFLEGLSVVPLRVRQGDDASCLNLNRAQDPRILGVDPAELSRRGAFFRKGTPDPWKTLSGSGDTIPVVGDTNTVVWGLGRKVGDIIVIRDDNGIARRLRISAVFPNSMLQGALLMADTDFTRLFPGRAGFQSFLVDSPASKSDAIGQELSRGLEDLGVSIERSGSRLQDFQSVENAYLSIFGMLGALGLMLGTLGLGVVVLRNILERRAELAALRALGFQSVLLERLVLVEHSLLFLAGMANGTLSAMVAIAPVLLRGSTDFKWNPLLLPMAGVVAAGILTTLVAVRLSLRGTLVAALRND